MVATTRRRAIPSCTLWGMPPIWEICAEMKLRTGSPGIIPTTVWLSVGPLGSACSSSLFVWVGKGGGRGTIGWTSAFRAAVCSH